MNDEALNDMYERLVFSLGICAGAMTNKYIGMRLAESIRKGDLAPVYLQFLVDQLRSALATAEAKGPR